MGFQTFVRGDQASAVPGTIVEAVDTYKYVRQGVVGEGATVHLGKFVVYDSTINGYRDVKQGDTEDKIAGLCVLSHYTTGEQNTSIYNAGESITVLENGIMASSVNADKGDTDKITVDLDSGNIFIGTITATITNKIELTKYKCVQHTGLGLTSSGVAFIKA